MKVKNALCWSCIHRVIVDWGGEQTLGCDVHNKKGIPLARMPMKDCPNYKKGEAENAES